MLSTRKSRVCRLAFLALAAVLFGVAGAVGDNSAPVLVRIEDPGTLTGLGIDVYAHLTDARGRPYALAVGSPEEVGRISRSILVLGPFEAPARGGRWYYTALERRPGGRESAARIVPVLHDDGRQIIVRAGPEEAEILAGMGLDLQRWPEEPLLLRAPLRPPVSGLVDYDGTVARLLPQVTAAEVYDLAGRLSGEWPARVSGSPYTIRTRHTRSGVPIRKATQFAFELFRSAGLNPVFHDWGQGSNVIAEYPGTSKGNEIVLITAHIDDMPSGSIAPGADDNASGSAAVLIAAGLLRHLIFERTLRFVLFSGEEQGLLGSWAYARDLAQANETVTAVLNLDMIAWDKSGAPTLRLHVRPPGNPGHASDKAIADLFVDVVSLYGLNGRLQPVVTADGDTASDHSSFWTRGYPAVLAIEDDYNDFNEHYHTVRDRLSELNMTYFVNFVRASLAATAHLALVDRSSGYLTGTVRNRATGGPVSGAEVRAFDDQATVYEATSSAAGGFGIRLGAGVCSVEVSAPGYQTVRINGVDVKPGRTTELDILLSPLASVPDGE